MPATKVLTHRELLERARQHATKQAAQASASQGDPVSEVKDPQEKGIVNPPSHPSQPKTEASMPAGTTGSANTDAAKTMETQELKADGTLKAETPSTTPGNPKDEAVTSPTQKLAKSVSATASKLLAMATQKSATEAAPKDSTKTEVSEKKEDKEKLPKDLPADKGIPPFAEKKEGEKAAGAEEFELPIDAYVKLASTILETEEGLVLATRLLKQAKGAEAAQALIEGALSAQDQFDKAASAYEQGAGLVDQIFANATPAEAEMIVKVASAHREQIAVIESQAEKAAEVIEAEKIAYAQGAMDAGAMEENGGELPGGTEETSNEDILAVIQQLVESGQLPPEVAEQLLMELQGGAEAEVGETEEEKSAAAKDPVAAMIGAHRKSASETAKTTADLVRAALAG